MGRIKSSVGSAGRSRSSPAGPSPTITSEPVRSGKDVRSRVERSRRYRDSSGRAADATRCRLAPTASSSQSVARLGRRPWIEIGAADRLQTPRASQERCDLQHQDDVPPEVRLHRAETAPRWEPQQEHRRTRERTWRPTPHSSGDCPDLREARRANWCRARVPSPTGRMLLQPRDGRGRPGLLESTATTMWAAGRSG